MRKRLTVVAAAVLLVAACGTEGADQETPDTDGSEANAPDSDPENTELTLEAVEANDSEESCWTVIDGVVYDLTDWISQHPGGANRILGLCGTDGTERFEGQHGDNPGPTNQLQEFELGPVE
ncbi:cytochrome b5 domain-containing protein [Spiractinospora alimapuensis]|uniref:cytochrome b5 domain-containing protein n=1 Tax=Spiractinospora alimapuensis TaxID=2820884 RepID=UPI001F1C841E|nr:cytochrome b5-like heme/steroid binding domain-containing protein [Spiractinospora alimapuensis]QVQ50919.1 cytochrome b5 domain-containing protein [Spiractinospora alimapuensis]